MSELKFTEDDFSGLPIRPNGMTPTSARLAADFANARLAEMLKDAPVVQGIRVLTETRTWWVTSRAWPFGAKATHTARLVDIKAIV